MTHTFTLDLPEDADINSGLEAVERGVKAENGRFVNDGHKGQFVVKGVHGEFILQGRKVTITITKKPFIVTNGFIENTIRELFASHVE